jgi:hypothetical protein
MRMHAVPPMLSFALLIGIAASPVTACELEQKAASHRTVTAFLTEHGRAATSTPLPQLVACKADGSACAADAECWARGRHGSDSGTVAPPCGYREPAC